jgi:hypothetical protein
MNQLGKPLQRDPIYGARPVELGESLANNMMMEGCLTGFLRVRIDLVEPLDASLRGISESIMALVGI